MSWLKQSDAAANHPLVLRILELESFDDRLLNEVYGWVNRCATQSAAHDMDYVVTVGTARMLAGSRYEALKAAAVHCGIFFEKEIREEVKDDDGNVLETRPRSVLKLVEEKDLFHMIMKSDKEREAKRRSDTYDKAKKGAVIHRDGSECRWCGRIVTFGNDRKSVRAGTIDHLEPKDLDSSEPTPIERLVVACDSCNSSRKKGEYWDKEINAEPKDPYYAEDAAAWLFKHAGIRVKASTERVELHAPTPTPAPEKVQAPALQEATVNDAATDTSGASASTKQEATEPGEVEHSKATERPARRERLSTSDLAIEHHDYSEMIEDLEREAVETPRQGETPAGGEATDTSGSPTAQSPINAESKNDQLIIKKAEGVGSGCAGTGRDGSGRDGLGRGGSPVLPSPAGSKPVGDSSPRSRRRRPRRRKKA